MPAAESIRVLLVDDDRDVLEVYRRLLVRQGWTVQTACDGLEAKECLERSGYDVLVSDVNMPGQGGLEFLRAVRELDLDVPVVLVTGKPSIESSMRAVEYGAFRYLLKPVDNDTFVDVVRQAARLHEMARLKRQALDLAGADQRLLGDRAALESRFAKATKLSWMAFQPIVSWRQREVFAYEALLRSDEPTLASPTQLLAAAERLGRMGELGRAVRAKVAEVAGQSPPEAKLFVNLHASDLEDDDLLDPRSGLAAIASRVVLEITERASLDSVKNAGARVEELKDMGFCIALDDLGAGYAGLTSFSRLQPDYVKLDMELVRRIDQDDKKSSIVRSMTRLCEELGIRVVAEGVETPAERDVLVGLGCDLLQGYLFAKPARGFPAPHF